ncbi:MAG: glutamate--tRNA ligase [Pyrinomonadaceae bacterium]|nr:glutamate--tRNA ligase [Phycisphaerales bacterium]
MSLVVTRFAPSPTGHLHIGGARSALFCWAFAKRQAGHFLLRIEDTDQARSSEESARGIMEDMAWLGIDWDEGPVLGKATKGGSDEATKGESIGGDPRGVKPFFQAQRVAMYDAYIMHLIRNNKAYPAFEKSEELEAKRKAAVAAKQTYRYDRAAYHAEDTNTPEKRLARMKAADAAGQPYVVRFLMPEEDIVVQDMVLGRVQYRHGEGGVDDLVIRKADGFPTYHFAVVIDDELMGITHVMRAQEHLNNTPRHVALQKALTRVDPATYGGPAGPDTPPAGTPFRTPMYAHMPLIFNMDGTKMSKRDKAKVARLKLKEKVQQLTLPAVAKHLGMNEPEVQAFLDKENDSVAVVETIARQYGVVLPEIEVSDFREAGYAPEAIVNFLGLLGWNPGMKLADGKDLEKFDMKFLADNFAIERIGTTNAKFDRAKLLSFNGDYLKALSEAEFARRWVEWLQLYQPDALAKVSADASTESDTRLLILVRAIKQRAKTFRDALKSAEFVFRADESTSFDAAAAEKNLLVNDRAGLKLLTAFRAEIDRLDSWTPEAIHGAMEALARGQGFVTEKGVNLGPLAQSIRVAIAGVPVTPPLGETMAVLGKAATLKRIDTCTAHFSR